MANNFIHGKLGTITIGGTFFASMQYTFEEATDLTDITFTTSTTVTFKSLLPGYNWATGVITFVYDTLNKPVLSPQNMIPGTLMVLSLAPDGVGPYAFSAYSGKFGWGAGPKAGVVSCTTNFESTGTIVRPAS